MKQTWLTPRHQACGTVPLPRMILITFSLSQLLLVSQGTHVTSSRKPSWSCLSIPLYSQPHLALKKDYFSIISSTSESSFRVLAPITVPGTQQVLVEGWLGGRMKAGGGQCSSPASKVQDRVGRKRG